MKMELMAATLQTFIKDPSHTKEDGKSHNEEGEGDGKGEANGKRKEEEEEKDSL